MTRKCAWIGSVTMALALASTAGADTFQLLTGVDASRAPGTNRTVFATPGPGIPSSFNDGDRLAGSADTGPAVSWLGLGAPLYTPNQFGALSFMFRRGSVVVPAPGNPTVPVMAIDWLGGPRLDLDGNAAAPRSLVPVTGQPAVPIPGSTSTLSLGINHAGGAVSLLGLDATSTNIGNTGLAAGNGVTVNVLAGTSTAGAPGAAINPAVDSRSGGLTSFGGSSGTLTSVYRISNLGYEIWQDPIEPTSSTASQLGTFQYLGGMRGWLIERDGSGNFPTLAGQGLGSTLWPTVAAVPGGTFNSAIIPGPAAILAGTPQDNFTVAGNGGTALAGFGGDLGAYLDSVVVPLIDPQAASFVYLESAGFGFNNGPDPVFGETVGYDVVLIAQSAPVPEPATAALMLAAMGLAVRRKREERGS